MPYKQMLVENPVWIPYYEELDPQKRKEILNQISPVEVDPKLYELRQILWEERYCDPKKKNQPVDHDLLACINLLLAFQIRRKKEILKIIETTGYDLAVPYGEDGLAVWYWEIRNAVRRYIILSKDDRSYRNGLFGLLPSTDKQRAQGLGEDLWNISVGIQRQIKIDSPGYFLLAKAAKDEFFECFPNAQELWPSEE